MTAEELLKNKYNLKGDRGNLRIDQVAMFMKEFAELKCQQLLEIVAEKAVIFLPSHPHIHGTHSVDKNSILNAVNLKEFMQ